jgi:hypothetical protein
MRSSRGAFGSSGVDRGLLRGRCWRNTRRWRRIRWRDAPLRFASPEQAIDQARRAGARIPPESKHGDLDALAAELQCLVAAPDVQVELSTLDLRSGIHNGVHAVVLWHGGGDVDDTTDRKQLRICGGYTRARGDA